MFWSVLDPSLLTWGELDLSVLAGEVVACDEDEDDSELSLDPSDDPVFCEA